MSICKAGLEALPNVPLVRARKGDLRQIFTLLQFGLDIQGPPDRMGRNIPRSQYFFPRPIRRSMCEFFFRTNIAAITAVAGNIRKGITVGF